MSAADYNGDVAASRKLTDDETKQLRGIIVKDLKYSPQEQEDVDDLLDYTFAMVSNGKALSYVVQELVSMEMDVCKEPQAHGIATQIAKFLQENVNPEEEEEHRMVSLKVCCCCCCRRECRTHRYCFHTCLVILTLFHSTVFGRRRKCAYNVRCSRFFS